MELKGEKRCPIGFLAILAPVRSFFSAMSADRKHCITMVLKLTTMKFGKYPVQNSITMQDVVIATSGKNRREKDECLVSN
jgi:hypothetical protein